MRIVFCPLITRLIALLFGSISFQLAKEAAVTVAAVKGQYDPTAGFTILWDFVLGLR